MQHKYNISGLNQFMVTRDFYSKINNNKYERGVNTFKKPQVMKSPNQNKVQKPETLFWAFYLLVFGDYDKKKEFQIKSEYCIKFIENIKKDNQILKEHKITLAKLEENLVYEKELNLNTIKILFLKNRKNIFLVFNNKYYLFEFDSEESFDCIVYKEGDISIEKDISQERKDEIKKSHFYVASTKKVLNSVSYYKIDEIKEIAQTLGISIIDESNQKKKNKLQLYTEISQMLF